MIDTDKYEGHSEGEWKVGARKGAMIVRDSNGEEIAATNSYSNARIMADAPLLLAEVKRLREENKELEEFLNESHASNKIWHERLIRAQKWAYKQVCHNDSAMMDYDDYVWGEEE